MKRILVAISLLFLSFSLSAGQMLVIMDCEEIVLFVVSDAKITRAITKKQLLENADIADWVKEVMDNLPRNKYNQPDMVIWKIEEIARNHAQCLIES